MTDDEHNLHGCGGLPGGCLECIWIYRLLTHPGKRNTGGTVTGRGEAVPVCIPCGHKHWAYERHADHQWDDSCPYEGTTCQPGGVEPQTLPQLVDRIRAEQPELLVREPLESRPVFRSDR